ncbi:MAG: hypothetical protein JNK15_00250 [Planctomycetes bacterium]|nr:hypothetical protein [Planctomycetota bacterium]
MNTVRLRPHSVLATVFALAAAALAQQEPAPPSPKSPAGPAPVAAKEPRRTPAEAKKFVESLGVELIRVDQARTLDTEWGPLELAAGKARALDRYQVLLAEELQALGKPLLQKLELKKVYVCGGMKLAGVTRGATPHASARAMYYDATWGQWSLLYQRRCVHHELFHYLDERDDGKVYQDPAFAALNAKDFTYGKGGAAAQGDDKASLPTAAVPGFLTPYARAGVEEDKAEVFSFLMIDPGYVAARAAAEPVLQQKVDFVRKLVRDHCPEFGPDAWPKAAPTAEPKADPAPGPAPVAPRAKRR